MYKMKYSTQRKRLLPTDAMSPLDNGVHTINKSASRPHMTVVCSDYNG